MYKLDRRVIIRRWSSIQNTSGGNIATQVASWNKWAEVQERSGSVGDNFQQRTWTYDTTIVMRFEKERPTRSNDTIDYEGTRYEVQSVSIKREGHKQWEVIRVVKLDVDINSDAPVDTDNIKVLNYTGVATENTFTSALLIGKTVFGAFKDGIEFRVLTSGSVNVNQKEVLFNTLTGQLTWSVAFYPGEQATIQYY